MHINQLADAALKGADGELESRRASWQRKAPYTTLGMLAKHAKLVSSASEGAVAPEASRYCIDALSGNGVCQAGLQIGQPTSERNTTHRLPQVLKATLIRKLYRPRLHRNGAMLEDHTRVQAG